MVRNGGGGGGGGGEGVEAFAKQVKSHTDSTEFAKKYLVGGENNP